MLVSRGVFNLVKCFFIRKLLYNVVLVFIILIENIIFCLINNGINFLLWSYIYILLF